MLVPFGAPFIEIVFSLLKAGVVAILIDPGIGRKHLIKCSGGIATRMDSLAFQKHKRFARCCDIDFPSAQWNVTLDDGGFGAGRRLNQIETTGKSFIRQPFCRRFDAIDPAAIIFTTGSTGPPKGVLYTHGTFHAQIDRIRERYDIHRGSRDLACFPLFGLFDAVMGVTTIIPDMDPTRPADVNPQRLIEAANQWEVDQAFGSPALWNTVVRWCEKNWPGERPFPTLRRVLSAGAPVPAATLEKFACSGRSRGEYCYALRCHRSVADCIDRIA